MKKLIVAFFAIMLLALGASTASAATINLFEFEFKGIPAPGTVINLAGFNTTTGIGSVVVTVSGLGNHSILGFFDHEIDEATNTFYNEYGSTSGSAAVGQSWEIDEPGYVFGDIYDNFTAGALDNTNGVPANSPDDVSMAMGWNFLLGANEYAAINFNLATVAPGSGFYLVQTDPDSQASIYLSSSLNIRPIGQQPVPEPSTIILMLSGLGLAAAMKLRKSH